ncbi:MAG: antitermination protein NusG, partial [Chloroflexi bacterium]|nr:antitermination protein NusG [Chloroflexota bacterium]
MTKQWYAIYVKSRHEKVIFSELRKKGIESSLPLMTTIRQWSDRRKK